jgi:preprotein translocase subunit YajC
MNEDNNYMSVVLVVIVMVLIFYIVLERGM